MNKVCLSCGIALSIVLIVCSVAIGGGSSGFEQKLIDDIAQKYFKAMAEANEKDLLEILEFENDNYRLSFQENLKKRGQPMKWDETKQIHHVRSEQKEGQVRYLYLVPTAQGYLPQSISIQASQGKPKVVYEKPKETKAAEIDVVSSTITELQQSLESWQNSTGNELADKAAEFKGRLKDQIAALEYAEEQKLQMVPGYGSLHSRLTVYETIKDLSDEEIRARLVQELKAALDSLSNK